MQDLKRLVCRAGLWIEFWDGGIETVRLESGPPGNEMWWIWII